MIVSSHDLNHVTEVCRRIAVIERGTIVRDIATGPDTQAELERYFPRRTYGVVLRRGKFLSPAAKRFIRMMDPSYAATHSSEPV